MINWTRVRLMFIMTFFAILLIFCLRSFADEEKRPKPNYEKYEKSGVYCEGGFSLATVTKSGLWGAKGNPTNFTDHWLLSLPFTLFEQEKYFYLVFDTEIAFLLPGFESDFDTKTEETEVSKFGCGHVSMRLGPILHFKSLRTKLTPTIGYGIVGASGLLKRKDRETGQQTTYINHTHKEKGVEIGAHVSYSVSKRVKVVMGYTRIFGGYALNRFALTIQCLPLYLRFTNDRSKRLNIYTVSFGGIIPGDEM